MATSAARAAPWLLALACTPTTAGAPAPSPSVPTTDDTARVEVVRLGVALPTHPDGIAALCVADGVVVAATREPMVVEGRTWGAVDPGVRVWGPAARLMARHGDAYVVALARVPGDQVAIAEVGGRVRITSLSGVESIDLGGGAEVRAMGWIAARDRLAIVRADGEITLASRVGAAPLRLGSVAAEITVAAVGRTRTVVGTHDGRVLALDLDTPSAAVRPLTLDGRAISAIALGPDGRTFAAGDVDGAVWLAEVGATAAPRPIATPSGWPTRALAILPSGHLVISTSTQGQYLRVHGPADGDVAILPAHDGPYDALAIDGDRLVTGSSDGIITAFDVVAGRELLAGPRNVAAPRAMAFDASGRTLVTYARPAALRWDLDRADATALRATELWPIAIAPGGTQAIVLDSERPAWAWTPVDTDRLGPWHRTGAFDLHVAFGGDLLGLAAHGGRDDGVASFELRRGEAVVAQWRAPAHLGVRGLVAAPDGTRWASLDDDDRTHVWSATGTLVCRGAEPRLNAEIAFGRDAGELVGVSQSHGIEVLDAASCTTVANLYAGDGDQVQGTTDAAWALASDPARAIFATGHESGLVRLWSLRDRRALWSRHEQTKLIERLAFDGAGRRLASAAQDGSLVVFRW